MGRRLHQVSCRYGLRRLHRYRTQIRAAKFTSHMKQPVTPMAWCREPGESVLVVGAALSFAISEDRRPGMDWNRIEGNWKQVRGKVKEQWGKLTDDDLNVINGRRDQLEGKIQERYGYAKDQVRKDIDDWYKSQKELTS